MEEFAIDLRNPAVAPHTSVIDRPRLSLRERVSAYVELTKPRITFLIVLTAAAGFALASQGGINYAAMLSAMFGMELRNGLETYDAPWPFLGVLGLGLMAGLVLTSFITRAK